MFESRQLSQKPAQATQADVRLLMSLMDIYPSLLAEKLGVTLRSVQYWLSGMGAPSLYYSDRIHHLIRIARSKSGGFGTAGHKKREWLSSIIQEVEKGQVVLVNVRWYSSSSEFAVHSVDPDLCSISGWTSPEGGKKPVEADVYSGEILSY